ncbi:MAG: non-canonical purine NTP pyrophosphatase [Phycisphaerales bacterium]
MNRANGMLELVVATGNPHKVEEFNALFAHAADAGPSAGGAAGAAGTGDAAGAGSGVSGGLRVRAIGLKDLAGGPFVEPEEVGTSFEQNASIKAMSYARQTGRLCLADDSGLVIDALDGRPGVISSHYCTDGREVGMSRAERDAANNGRVLAEMVGVPEEMRSARFVCVIALAEPRAGLLVRVRGVFEGRIGSEPRVPSGENGFGYDPLFLVADATAAAGGGGGGRGGAFSVTSAELAPEVKNRVSHRARACAELLARLPGLFPAERWGGLSG